MSDERDWVMAEHDRRIAMMLRPGVIAEVNLTATPASARVTLEDGWESDFLPVFQWASSAGFSTWNAPEVGEQVKVFSPSGEPGAGTILRGLPSSANPSPSADPMVTVLGKWLDGALDAYDRNAHQRTIQIPAGGTLTLMVGAGTEVQITDGACLVKGAAVQLGDAGGQPVARVGDMVNLQTGKILTGSGKVTAA